MKSTMDDCFDEIAEIIDGHRRLTERYQALRDAGYSLGERAFFKGGVGAIKYMAKETRAQVGKSLLSSSYYMCVILPPLKRFSQLSGARDVRGRWCKSTGG